MKRHSVALTIALLAVLPQTGRSEMIVLRPWPPSAALRADISAAAPLVAALTQKEDPTLATINGTPISQRAFDILLRRDNGKRIFEQLALLTLVQTALAESGAPMDAKSASARLQAELNAIAKPINSGSVTTLEDFDQQFARALGELRPLSVTEPEFRMALEIQAGIAQLLGQPASVGFQRSAAAQAWVDNAFAHASVVITDPALAAQFRLDAAPGSNAPKFSPKAAPDNAHIDLATVNGKNIDPATFNNLLRKSAGLQLFNQTLDLMLAQRASAGAGITFDERSLQDRVLGDFDKLTANGALLGTVPTHSLGQPSTPGAAEFRLALHTRTLMRALAESQVSATDEDIQQAYRAEYGERRRIRIFILGNDPQTAARNATQLRTMLAAGKNPEAAAQELKEVQTALWIISQNAKDIPDILQVAFKQLQKRGELSDIMQYQSKVGLPPTSTLMLQLDDILPDQSAQKPLTEDLRKDIQNKILQFKQDNWINQELGKLRSQAAVQINDPDLAQQVAAQAAQLKKLTGQ